MTKKKDPKDYEKRGRPTIFTPEIIDKLEYAFLMGLKDEDACIWAGVSKTAFYEFRNKNPDFKDKEEKWKRNLSIRARINVASEIGKGDISTSKWWLERQDKDDFSTKVENVNTGTITLQKVYITEDDKKAVEEHIADVVGEH